MGIDMTKYKMIYKDRVYNCISLCFIECYDLIREEGKGTKLKVAYIDENNRLQEIEDNKDEFQFIVA